MKPQPPPKGPERKRWIVDQLQAGAKQVDLAAQTGLTRQAVSLVWKRYQAEGEAFLQKSGRRPREADTLSSKEKQDFVDWLRNHPPSSTGEEAEAWSLYGVKRAVRQRLGKSVKVAIAADLFWTAFPEGASKEAPPSDPTPALPDETGESVNEAPQDPEADALPSNGPPRTASGIEGDPDLPSIEEMERMNREALADHNLPPHPGIGGKAGIRTGKHSKGKKNPRPKPKRRKKRR